MVSTPSPNCLVWPQRNKLTIRPQAQTPAQRRANEKYAKQESAKRGKPESAIKKKEKFKSPVSTVWIGMSYPRENKGRLRKTDPCHSGPCIRSVRRRPLRTLPPVLLMWPRGVDIMALGDRWVVLACSWSYGSDCTGRWRAKILDEGAL
jgi:hypothetical protein